MSGVEIRYIGSMRAASPPRLASNVSRISSFDIVRRREPTDSTTTCTAVHSRRAVRMALSVSGSCALKSAAKTLTVLMDRDGVVMITVGLLLSLVAIARSDRWLTEAIARTVHRRSLTV
jgi:hypothetical protein